MQLAGCVCENGVPLTAVSSSSGTLSGLAHIAPDFFAALGAACGAPLRGRREIKTRISTGAPIARCFRY
jgi:hypothetical protein